MEIINNNEPVFFSCRYIDHTINEHSFYKIDELPEGAKKTIDVSNGQLTECYYITNGDVTDYYRPNPNAKPEDGGAYVKVFDNWENERKYRLKYC
jgi:hypothetical protein